MSYHGKFRPKNPSKYVGDPSGIIYRSLWELRMMRHLDETNNIIKWASEELRIPYMSPFDGMVHTYYPDFWLQQRKQDGKLETIVVEVKPAYQRVAPVPPLKRTRRHLREWRTWGVNNAKWEAAEEYCKNNGWRFQIIDEYGLGIKKRA